jgi:hypothetical protein
LSEFIGAQKKYRTVGNPERILRQEGIEILCRQAQEKRTL